MLFIINPKAKSEKARSVWLSVEGEARKLFPQASFCFTEKKHHGTELARRFCQSVENPFIVVVGGDGTLSEVINGVMVGAQLLNPGTTLALIPLGTGNDFARSLGLPTNVEKALRLLKNPAIKLLDLGFCEFKAKDKTVDSRYFINGFSCGVGAQAAKSVVLFKPYVGARLSYFLSTVYTLLLHKPYKLEVSCGEKSFFFDKLHSFSVANGSYFGGGMHLAPHAKVDSKKLEVVLFEKMSKVSLFFNLPRVYNASHLKLDSVKTFAVNSLFFKKPEDQEFFCELDGEVFSGIPQKISCLPQVVRIVIF